MVAVFIVVENGLKTVDAQFLVFELLKNAGGGGFGNCDIQVRQGSWHSYTPWMRRGQFTGRSGTCLG